jgi:3-hydroxyisobutyrate dehydrogenase-like beta-hydroxyacid dehydrogenase
MIVSVCPPHAALGVARSVSGFRGVYVDANAIAPGTAREVAAIVQVGGATYVDGGIIGPPPATAGTTRLYLSGSAAAEVRDLFAGTPLDARIITAENREGVAADVAPSALKMAYAAWTKGSAALLLTARALAEAAGVADALRVEWEMSQPGLLARCRSAERSAAAKGWRWTAEMEEIAATMAAAGLPPGFHLAAAEVFRDSLRDSSAAERA